MPSCTAVGAEVQLPYAVEDGRAVGEPIDHVVLHVVPETGLVRERERTVPCAPVLAVRVVAQVGPALDEAHDLDAG